MKDNKREFGQAYQLAQTAMANLKSAVFLVLSSANSEGLRNADIGRALGIYMGHVEHEGHIPRTLLAIMEAEGVVEQDKSTKLWRLKTAAGKYPAIENPKQ